MILSPAKWNAISKEPQPKDRCFHLSENDCDCDVVFYCNLICQDEGKSGEYNSATETCCCV